MQSLKNLCAAIKSNSLNPKSMSCRICLEAGVVYKLPCACRNTLGYVHAHCFVQWMVQRYTRVNGNVCEVCGMAYRDLQSISLNNYTQAVVVIMRCLHAFTAYAACMFTLCCFWAFSNNVPLDADACNAGLLVIVLLTAGTFIHFYQCLSCDSVQLVESPARCQSMLHNFIVSCDKVEEVEGEV